MRPKRMLPAIWIDGNHTLFDGINHQLTGELVADIQARMGWKLTSPLNDRVWEALEDETTYE